ncbi:MAG: hypothetical protein ABSE90_04355 [Verrucomicrobiota bacterium]
MFCIPRRCQPRPVIVPPFTSAAPTIGFGEAAPAAPGEPEGEAHELGVRHRRAL